MEWSGLALLILVGVGIITTGLPAAFVLITVAVIGAVFGIAAGVIPASLLWALPSRLINLFDNDLLHGFAALRHHGLAARPSAGSRGALSHQHRGLAAPAVGAADLRHCCSARCSVR